MNTYYLLEKNKTFSIPIEGLEGVCIILYKFIILYLH